MCAFALPFRWRWAVCAVVCGCAWSLVPHVRLNEKYTHTCTRLLVPFAAGGGMVRTCSLGVFSMFKGNR